MHLQLGAGLTWGQIDLGNARLVSVDTRPDDRRASDVVVRGPRLHQTHCLGPFPGRSVFSGGLCADETGAFVSATGGAWFFPLVGAPTMIAGLPAMPFMSAEAYEAVWHRSMPPPNDAERAHYLWHFQKRERLTALCGRLGAASRLVSIDVGTGAIELLAVIPGWTGRLEVDLDRKALLLEPPMVRGFDGEPKATLADLPRAEGGDASFWIPGHDAERLRRWYWQRGEVEQFPHEAMRPAMASTGDVFFLKASTELWRKPATGDFERLVAPAEDLVVPLASKQWGLSGAPVVSPSGRFVVATLVIQTSNTAVLVDTVILDLKSGVVEQLTDFWRMDFAFTGG